MKCRQARELFSSYLEHTIQPPMGVALEQHLAECGECKAVYGKFHATAVVLDELPSVEPPTDLHAMIMARVQEAHRAVPAPVRWWNFDWQRAFTVRVPAKAVAFGAALLLAFVVLGQFGPLQTMTASLLGGQRAGVVSHDGTSTGVNPLPSGFTTDASAKYVAVGGGLSVGVRVVSASASSTLYALRLTSASEPIRVQVTVRSQSSDTKSYVATVSRNHEAAIQADVTQPNGEGTADVAIIKWTSGGQSYGEYVFLPSAFGLVERGASVSMNDAGAFRLLRHLSSTYGAVILAPDYLRDIKGTVSTSAKSADAAIEAVSRQTDLGFKTDGSSVYVVK